MKKGGQKIDKMGDKKVYKSVEKNVEKNTFLEWWRF